MTVMGLDGSQSLPMVTQFQFDIINVGLNVPHIADASRSSLDADDVSCPIEVDEITVNLLVDNVWIHCDLLSACSLDADGV